MKPKFTFFLQTLKEEGRGGGMENEVSSHGSLLCFWCKIYSIYWPYIDAILRNKIFEAMFNLRH